LFDNENDPLRRTLSPDAIPELNLKSCSNYLPPVSPVLNIKQYRNKKKSRKVCKNQLLKIKQVFLHITAYTDTIHT
jgi:hypothetical protein